MVGCGSHGGRRLAQHQEQDDEKETAEVDGPSPGEAPGPIATARLQVSRHTSPLVMRRRCFDASATAVVVGNPAVSDERPVAFRPTLAGGLAFATDPGIEQPMCHG